MTSGSKADGRVGKQDFVYMPDEDAYRCPSGEKLKDYFGNVERGLLLRRYWTTACHTCPLKSRCTTAKERRIVRWEHEDVLEAVQRRLDQDAHGRHALADEDLAKGEGRDGVARAGL